MKQLFLILALLVCSAHGSADIELKRLASGKERSFTWTVDQVLIDRDDIHLIVMIRNTGAKHLNAEGLDASNFSLKDGRGMEMKIWRATGFTGVAYEDVTVGHLVVDGPLPAKASFSLELKKRPEGIVPVTFKAEKVTFVPSRRADPTTAEQAAPSDGDKPSN